ncbi:hypothetical protein SNE40_005349 [Patella caerulea]|uniref:G-protein coupled receptors family 2 profile 2 domain-containing protein n=1 Tax=Patella caerulea TaxID=87958 RepID=A0AAN8Q4J8_PATCE
MKFAVTLITLSSVLTVFGVAGFGFELPEIPENILEILGNFSCGADWECPSDRNNSTDSFCSCDEFCELVGVRDCCQGYQLKDKTIFTTSTFKPSNFRCLDNALADAAYDVLMVYTCPDDWKGEIIRDLCEYGKIDSADFQTIPVSGVLSGLVYKNQYCARCHREKFEFWKPHFGCSEPFISRENPDEKPAMSELVRKGTCAIDKVIPPDGYTIRRCSAKKHRGIVDSCPPSFNQHAEVKKLCEETDGIRPVYYIGETKMKNIYCGYCGTRDVSQYECPKPNEIKRLGEFYPFTILFNINDLEKGDNSKTNVVCEKHQVFDPFSDVCRDAYCGENQIFQDGECISPAAISGRQLNGTGGYKNCPRIALDKSEFKISENGVLTVLNSNYVFDLGDYELTDNGTGALVCTNFTRNSTSSEVEYSFDKVQGILTVVGIALSIIGCLITIAVYLSFKSLRNIPGKIVIALCITLIMGYLAMMIGPAMENSYSGCKTFAILMHYSFLLAFFWMNVMAIDVWYTFSKAYYQAGTQAHKTNRFKFYMVYVFIMATTPVSLAIILNETEIGEGFAPHYGEGVCWINRKNALMVFFGLPSLLVILSNVVLFVVAAKTIYVAQKNSARLLGKEDKGMLGIYVRLTCVMGLTYLFGFLAPVVNHPVTWYLFIILNTLQGVFIFVSFVCTHKVIGLARERASTLSHSRSDNSYTASRSPTKSSVLSFRAMK